MIPILYEANETEFVTNGIGRLADAISCTVSEKLNGEYELELIYPVSGEFFSELETQRIILAKPADTGQTQPFRIYEITKPLDGRIEVLAQHISYDLSGVPVEPFYATGASAVMAGLITHSMVSHPYSVWTDIDNVSTPYRADKVRSFRACLGGEKNSVLDAFRQVEYEFDRFTVKAHRYRGTDNGVSIRYGKNLTDIEHESSSEKMYTGVVAQWTDMDTDACIVSEVQHTAGYESAPFERIFVLDTTSDIDDEPTVEELNNIAMEYISSHELELPSVNIKVAFVPLWQTEEYKNISALERVSMGDTVHVYFSDFGINATAKVIVTEYDVLNERYIEIELGDAKQSLSKSIKNSADAEMADTVASLQSSIRGVYGAVEQAEEDMQSTVRQALIDATNVLTGGTGGYVYINLNADGQPNEIYIMDSPDMETAVNVLKINNAGIGGSTTGVNGIVNMAVLIDGTINASQITTGTLKGNLIEAGTILTSALEVSAQDLLANLSTHFSFLADGLHIMTEDADYQTLISTAGMRVISNETSKATLVAEGESVTAENLTANTYLRIKGTVATSRFQAYHDNVDNEDMVGCYWEVTE